MTAMDLPGSRRRIQTAPTTTATPAVPAVATKAKAPAVAYLSRIALALMTTSSVASLRAAPTYGPACVFLYLLPAAMKEAYGRDLTTLGQGGEIEHMALAEAPFLRRYADRTP